MRAPPRAAGDRTPYGCAVGAPVGASHVRVDADWGQRALDSDPNGARRREAQDAAAAVAAAAGAGRSTRVQKDLMTSFSFSNGTKWCVGC